MADESNENSNAKREVKQSSNATQANSALSLRVLYLADEVDAQLFEDPDIKKMFEVGYKAVIQEKKNHKFAEK